MACRITISGSELQDYWREHYRKQDLPETITRKHETELATSTSSQISINSLLSKADLIIDADTAALETVASPEQSEETMKYLEFKKRHEDQFRQEIKYKGLSLSRNKDTGQETLQY